jgi:hypothetical protein
LCRNGTEAGRLAAIKKAQSWWNTEGKATYTFDYIEAKRAPANPAPF